MKIAIIDVCDTLFYSNTTFDFLHFRFKDDKKYKKLIFIKKNILYRLVNKLIFKCFHIDLTKIMFTKLLKGMPLHSIENDLESFYQEFLVKRKIEKTHEILKKYQKNGYHIILLSASYDFIVKKIAMEMGVNEYIATSLMSKKNNYTGKIKEDILQKKLKKFLEKNYEYDELVVMTDNITDFNLTKISNVSHVVINNKNKNFWLKNNSSKFKMIEV